VRILLDGCVPRRLGRDLGPHEVSTLPAMGWSDLDDGPLLDRMAGRFDVLVTTDKSIPHQQNLAERPVAVIVLRAESNRLADLRPLVPELRATLDQAKPGQFYEVVA